MPLRLGTLPEIGPDELLSSWVSRIEAYFEAPGLLWGPLGCAAAVLDTHPPGTALGWLGDLTGQSRGQLERHLIASFPAFGRVGPGASAPSVCPECLADMATGPTGLYLRRSWAEALRTTCLRHARPLSPLVISGPALFCWRDDGRCVFAHRVNQSLLEACQTPGGAGWRDLAAFEEAVMNCLGPVTASSDSGCPVSEFGSATVIGALFAVWGDKGQGFGRAVARWVPDAFAPIGRPHQSVALAAFAEQSPETRRLFTSALMEVLNGHTPTPQTLWTQIILALRSLAPESADRGRARSEPLRPKGSAHQAIAARRPLAALPASLPSREHTWPGRVGGRVGFRLQAEALLASDAGRRAVQLQGAARKRALGALMRAALDEAVDQHPQKPA
ncbi:MAG: TniQ family protein [Paracoccaceae bacterium]|nr:TniQ family protein [Paracoccaceae bacterium]